MLERLQALGYAATGSAADDLPSPLEKSERFHPHRRARELQRYLKAIRYANQGEVQRAIAILQRLTEQNPRYTAALTFLSGYLLQQRRPAEARAVLEKLHAQGYERAATRLNLGFCLESAGELESAAEEYLRALSLDPSDVKAHVNLIRVFETLDRPDEAEAIRELLEELSSGAAADRDRH